MAAASRIGRVAAKNSALFLCDMQEMFRKTIKHYPSILNVSNRLLKAAEALDVPVIVTEQYPKGLGPTVPELEIGERQRFAKTKFSMFVPEIEDHIKNNIPDLKSIILCGIETQACIQQTVFDAVDRGYDVHVIVDGCSSRSMVDRMYAFERIREAGAYLTTSESMVLELARDAKHPNFKVLQKLIWDPAPDSGLLTMSDD